MWLARLCSSTTNSTTLAKMVRLITIPNCNLTNSDVQGKKMSTQFHRLTNSNVICIYLYHYILFYDGLCNFNLHTIKIKWIPHFHVLYDI